MTKSAPLRFKRKTYGRGWTPSTRQGWTVAGVYTLIIVAGALIAPQSGQTIHQGENLMLLLWLIVPTICFIRICYRTGPKPKRQWGDNK